MNSFLAAVVLGAGFVSAQEVNFTGNAGPGASTEYPGPAGVPYPNSYYPGFEDAATDAGAMFGQTSPPKYPSPWVGTGAPTWAAAIKQAQDFVSQLTLPEKVNLTTGVGWEGDRCVGNAGGVPRLGFRSLCLQDSPVGVRDTDYNSVFPGGVTIAATFDRGLFYQRGNGMGAEHYGKGVDMQLGPVVGPLGRSPEGGRNWEGFSPDPVLSGIAVAQHVYGIQDAGVIACTKHFIGYEQEHFRQAGESAGYGYNITESVSSNIDDVTMHELYLWPFADAVRAGTAAFMCSYNQVNNSYGCSNSYTQNYLLKGELGFQGLVVSDWGGHHSGVGDALAGLDMSMPGDIGFDSGTSFWGANLTVAVLNGTVPEWRVDDMATRIMAAFYYVGRSNESPEVNFDSWTLDTYGNRFFESETGYQVINEHVNVQGDHSSQIRNQAARGTVLLKNTANTLPLTGAEKFTGVIGDDAGPNVYGPNGCSDRGCDMGVLGMAWGSGSANFPFLVTPDAAIENYVLSHGGAMYASVLDNNATSQIESVASQSTVAIVFVNADSGEGYIQVDGNLGDRNNLTLWQGGDLLIEQVASMCNNTVVVVHSTGPVLMPWSTNDNITAILWAGVPGEQAGNSIVDVLYGAVSPAARLPFTIGAARADYGTDILYQPNNGQDAPQSDFAEGVFIDYRAFDLKNVTPTYEFGFGLSYSTFAYSDLNIINHGHLAYNPATGMTAPAPVLGSVGTAADYLFPAGFTQLKNFIYPYLNSTDLASDANDPDYGQATADYVPAGAQDGSAQPIPPAGGAPGGNPELWDVLFSVSATITNTGKINAEEVPQLYISLGGPNDPKVALRNFERLSIDAGMSTTFYADITRKDLSNWDTAAQDWFISSYEKKVFVGPSSRNLPLTGTLPISGVNSTVTSGMPKASMQYGTSSVMNMTNVSK